VLVGLFIFGEEVKFVFEFLFEAFSFSCENDGPYKSII